MGANCCAATKSTSLQGTTISTYRNLNQSPPWSFRWDNRTHVEDLTANHSHRIKGNSDSKLEAAAETEGLSDKGSNSPCPSTASQARQLNGSPINIRVSWKFGDEVGEVPSANKPRVGVLSHPSSVFEGKPSFTRSPTLPFRPSSSRKTLRTEGYKLSNPISDGHSSPLSPLKELSSNITSVSNNDLSPMHAFSELTSSQREIRSFGNDKITTISSRMRQSIPASPDHQECKICNHLLMKKSSWSFQKVAPTKGPCVAAVLFCGHVYHAECLEKLTPETDMFDPPCPVCIHGEHFNSRLVGNAKSGASGKISRIVVVGNNGMDGDMISEYQRSAGRVRRIGISSSMKGAFSKHFMGHLSLKRSVSECESARKRDF